MTEIPGSTPPAAGASDSAGVPWQRRELTPSGFENDDGSADPALVDALAGTDQEDLMSAVAGARFLVAVVAQATDITPGPDGLVHDAQVDMALVTLRNPEGDAALPAFTGLDALAAWDESARPVAVTAERMAQAAITEGCGLIVIDLGGPHARELRPSQVWALAQQRSWLPPERDPFVAASVAAAVRSEERITAASLYAAEPGAGVLGVELALVGGLAADAVRDLVTRIGERLATDGEFRARIDGLAFRLRPGDVDRPGDAPYSGKAPGQPAAPPTPRSTEGDR